MCQTEKDANRIFLSLEDPNCPATRCTLEQTLECLPPLLTEYFGYHDEKKTTACSCRNKQDPDSHSPVKLPFAIGEISKKYQDRNCMISKMNAELIEEYKIH